VWVWGMGVGDGNGNGELGILVCGRAEMLDWHPGPPMMFLDYLTI